jgi:type I restriction-modification system DNA methylase subunit
MPTASVQVSHFLKSRYAQFSKIRENLFESLTEALKRFLVSLFKNNTAPDGAVLFSKAETEGFEPSVPFLVRLFSKEVD